MTQIQPSSPADSKTPIGRSAVERMYFAWNDALSNNDVAAPLAWYAPDSVLESPLIPVVLRHKRGKFERIFYSAPRVGTWLFGGGSHARRNSRARGAFVKASNPTHRG
jgi:hypothetical protein